jgi:hypothetical protein
MSRAFPRMNQHQTQRWWHMDSCVPLSTRVYSPSYKNQSVFYCINWLAIVYRQ